MPVLNQPNLVDGDPTPTGGTSGLTWAIGGGLATIQQAMDDVDAGDTIYVEAGTYTETVDIKTAGNSSAPIKVWPYTTTPGDGLG